MISPRHERVTTVVERYIIDSPANAKDVSDVIRQVMEVERYIIDSPANAKDVSDVIRQVMEEHGGARIGAVLDDSIKVIARDNEIHFEIRVADTTDNGPWRSSS